jgi:hypothetical protein
VGVHSNVHIKKNPHLLVTQGGRGLQFDSEVVVCGPPKNSKRPSIRKKAKKPGQDSITPKTSRVFQKDIFVLNKKERP